MSLVCCSCATPIPDESRFCLSCGSSVSNSGEGRPGDSDGSAMANMERLLRVDTRGEYEIERLLGTGGMAAVYLATEARLARRVAIKVLPPELTYGKSVERFIREAQTAASLEHTNIIQIHRVASGDRVFWYAMKYVEGRTLEDKLKDRRLLSLDDAIGLLAQIGSGLDYAHARHVVHRDIKPANIMIDRSGRAIVTDFGIAKALSERTLTVSGTVVGTPNYMSAEQAIGDPVTGAADQYALAVIAYQMLAGHLPFEGGSAIDIVHKHCKLPPPPLEALRPGLPSHVYAAVEKALAKSPDDRFPTVSAFVEGLRRPWDDGAATLLIRHGGASRRQNTPQPASRRSRLTSVLTATAFAATAFVGLKLTTRWADRREESGNLPGAAVSPVVDTTSNARTQPGSDSAQSALQITPWSDSAVTTHRASIAEPVAASPRVSVAILQTQGGWADIYVDGERRRQASVHRDTLPPGTHTFRFERKGYAIVDTTITLPPGETIVRVAMRPNDP